MKQFKKKDYKEANFGNNTITLECLLAVDYKSMPEKHFQLCLSKVPEINKLIMSREKCDSQKQYDTLQITANALLTMVMIEKRML